MLVFFRGCAFNFWNSQFTSVPCYTTDWIPIKNLTQFVSYSFYISTGQLPQRAKTAVGQRDIAVDTKDLSKRMMKLSFGRVPKGHPEPVLFYRRTLNGRADKLHVNGEITLDKAPWRGASYDKINHVDHRRYTNLEGKYYWYRALKKNKGLFALFAWKLGGSVGRFFYFFIFFNLDVEEMQYKSYSFLYLNKWH